MMKTEVSKGGHATVFSDEGVLIEGNKKHEITTISHSGINMFRPFTQ
jgi:hypothetical protein